MRIPKLTRKNSSLLAVMGVVFIVVGVIAIITLNTKHEPTPLMPVEDVRSTAQDIGEEENADAGLAYIDEQIEQRTSDDEKQQLLVYKAEFARSAGRHDEALEAAKRANEISPTLATSQALAEASEAAGNNEEAVAHYRKMIELVESAGDEMLLSYTILWEAKIEELEQ